MPREAWGPRTSIPVADAGFVAAIGGVVGGAAQAARSDPRRRWRFMDATARSTDGRRRGKADARPAR
jgi:hypothetical protein